MSDIYALIAALPERWRERAPTFMAKAGETRSAPDVVRLTALASSLEFCARELSELTKERQ